MRMLQNSNQKITVPVVYIAAMFMAVMDTTIVNVALPTIAHQFHTRPGEVGLVSSSYLISLTIFIPVSGWLGDRLGGKFALLGSIGVFTIASALCGMSTNFAMLVIFRVFQGIGGAIMTPVGLSMLFRVYPPAERVRIAALIAIFTAIAPALGPILGGIFTTYWSWRLVFFVNVLIGIVICLYGSLQLTRHTQHHPGKFDWQGFCLSGLGLGMAMYAISEGSIIGWSNPVVLFTLIIGVVFLISMVIIENRSHHPLVNLRLFRNRLFTICTSLYGLASISYLGALYLSALFLQDAQGKSALQSGLTIFPSAVGVVLGGQIVARKLYRRFGPRRTVVGGLLIITITLVFMSSVTLHTNLWYIRLIMFGLGLGVAAVFISSQTASMATIDKVRTGQASSIFNSSKQLGSAIGVAVSTILLSSLTDHNVTNTRTTVHLLGYHVGFLAGALTAALSLVVARMLQDDDAIQSMTKAK
ncbi:MDR family MFS transporter [Alicyclobacillus fodiniaquatilis]|uniref:MDR family MFS transporter n=1 Tax=Alicyclobacillus fodiniaquatilis TaxID=1661150 RepID=A0ABW4JH67_9BACL